MEKYNEELYIKLMDFDSTKRKEWMEKRKPFSVLFELTAQCNMNCIHCYLQNHHVSNQLSYNQIIKILDILYEKGILFITFTGGEIFIRDDFIDIYLYAKKKGFLVELFTNGYLITDEIIEILKKYPPLLVDISLYGANEETYYKVTRIKNAFEKVIDNCKKLKNAGIRTFMKSPIIKPTISEIDEMQSIADNIGVPFIYTFEICYTIDKCNATKKLQVELKDALKYEFKNFYEQVEKGEKQLLEDNTLMINKLKENEYVYSCNVAKNSFVIDYEGRICPCMKLRHRGLKLEASNFDLLWNDFKKYSQFRASGTYVCKKCDARYYCDICPGEMEFLYSDMEYRPRVLCKSAKIRKMFYEGKVSFEEALSIASSDEII